MWLRESQLFVSGVAVPRAQLALAAALGVLTPSSQEED